VWKKDLEKLELEIAREKDREVSERLKAVLEARQRERRERNLHLQKVGIDIEEGFEEGLRKACIVFIITLIAGTALVLLIVWIAGRF